MTNEQLVERIRNGFSVTDDMQTLYENNLPLIKRYIRPYIAYESLEDCLQEAYFGLWEATKHYEVSENVSFMIYAGYWIRQAVQRYIEKCGSVIRIPTYTRQKILRYKKNVQELSQELGRTPTDYEIAEKMSISVERLPLLKMYSQGIASLDIPLATDDNLTLCDTIQADFSLEDTVIDQMYEKYSTSELWSVVEHYTDDRENNIIKEYFMKNKSMPEIAKEQGISTSQVREIKQRGLNKLRMGKARRKLLQKFDVVDAGLYRTGVNKFIEHNFTSTVEYVAIRRAEFETEYKERTKQLESKSGMEKSVFMSGKTLI